VGARINWRDAAGMEGQVELGFGEIFVGRAMECAIRTDDPLVSRRHARIYFQNGSHVIEDLQSANGIYLGEVKTPSHVFRTGDNVRAGNLWMTYSNDVVSAFPSPAGGPHMSPGGGTQILQVNEAFIPGRSSEASGGSMPSPPRPSGLPGMPPSFGGGAPSISPIAPMSSMGPPMPPMPSFGGMGGPPPPVMGPPSISGQIGGSIGGGMSGPPPPMPGPPPPMPGGRTSSAGGGGAPVLDAAEYQRMQRRIDQLSSELRLIRGGGDKALRMEELEERASRTDKQYQELESRYRDLEKLTQQTGADYNPNRANLQLSRTEEVVSGLNDVLSELRINLLAAEGEIEQYAQILPAASYELVREAIRSSRMQMETARDIMRMLREVRG
jgi:FHA domain